MSAKHSSGTSDTRKGGTGCPCGRPHPDTRPWRRQRRSLGDQAEMVDAISTAYAAGKASGRPERGEHVVHYAGDCLKPLLVKQSASRGALFVTYETRCRKCGPCRRAKMAYWALAAVEQTRLAAEQGRRTWFGTLTLRPEAVTAIKDRAFSKWAQEQAGSSVAPPDWWDDPQCDERFRMLRDELVHEVQLYWKRLRKAGHRFKYFLVFERHKSGEPHMHWLLHEEGEPILKRQLSEQWPLGFAKVKLVRDYSCQNRSAERVAWYVAKYLGKAVQARQIASRLYRPSRKQDVKTAPLGIGAEPRVALTPLGHDPPPPPQGGNVASPPRSGGVQGGSKGLKLRRKL